MARYTGPKCRQCRREGQKLYLKGAKCLTDKCPVSRRPVAPGQHGKSSRGFISDYARQLREKQKAKRIYGLLESQFRKYYEEAARVKGVTGQALLQMLESRLDNVLYVSGLAQSRAQARSMIGQGKVTVNGKMVDIASYRVAAGDEVTFENAVSTPKEDAEMPVWISWDKSDKAVKIKKLPEREEMKLDINEQLIVEYYSR